MASARHEQAKTIVRLLQKAEDNVNIAVGWFNDYKKDCKYVQILEDAFLCNHEGNESGVCRVGMCPALAEY